MDRPDTWPILSAFGDWCPTVPAGRVGVLVSPIGGKRDSGIAGFLVDTRAYDGRPDAGRLPADPTIAPWGGPGFPYGPPDETINAPARAQVAAT